MRHINTIIKQAKNRALREAIIVGGGDTLLLFQSIPGTRDYAFMQGLREGYFDSAISIGRIDLVRYGRMIRFTLTPLGLRQQTLIMRGLD